MKPHHWRNWPSHRSRSRRFVFWRFAVLFGGLAFLFLSAVAIVVFFVLVLTSQTGLDALEGLALIICAVPIGFVIFATVFGAWGFRRVGAPFADIFSAVEAVSEGDLGVRVREHGRGQFARFGHRFNNMVAELQRAEQQRRNMTADIAHELRTPLHIIQGNLEGMIDGVYPPNEETLNATLEETRLLTHLVNDLQTLSLAESGQLPMHPALFPVSDLYSDITTSFSAQAAAQSVELIVEPPDGNIQIYGDPHRLNQVFSNLVANALRHTPAGGRIVLRAEESDEGTRLSVRDNGVGIPPEDLPYIFDRFWRGDRARTRASGAGSGLGLAIARQLVHAHGGQISVESQPGEGAVFTVVLPAEG